MTDPVIDPAVDRASPAAGDRDLRIFVERQPVDDRLFDQIVADESLRLGLPAVTHWVDELSIDDLVSQGPAPVDVMVVRRPDAPDVHLPPAAGSVLLTRVDLVLRDPDRSAGVSRHIAGRGIDGIRWALRAVHHHRRSPAHRARYGSDAEQFGELRLPVGAGPHPVVALLHGGFWRSRWQLDLMDALAVDLSERGMASWNIEYRRPDRHGWAATCADVAAAMAHIRELAAEFPIDAGRVAVVGHSAGGQLATRYAADMAAGHGEQGVRLVVSLAGVLDLVQALRRDLGEGAVPRALGGHHDEIPDVYAQACPLRRLPIPVDQLVVVGDGDSPDLREMSRRYAAAAAPRARLLEGHGDHFTVIDPDSRVWSHTADAIAAALGPAVHVV